MKKIMIAVMTMLMVVFFQAGTAQAFDVRNAGIFSQEDAVNKCPKTCELYGGWNGHWTTLPSLVSVCGCLKRASGSPNDVNAGAILNQRDAEDKCPKLTRLYGGWNGQWTTLSSGMAVCGSNENWH